MLQRPRCLLRYETLLREPKLLEDNGEANNYRDVGTCSEEFGTCNTNLENCMNAACMKEYEDELLKDATCLTYSEIVKVVLDTLGGSAFESSTEKHCDCK